MGFTAVCRGSPCGVASPEILDAPDVLVTDRLASYAAIVIRRRGGGTHVCSVRSLCASTERRAPCATRAAGRRRRPSPMIAAAERAAAKPAARASEPIQFRLAEGNR